MYINEKLINLSLVLLIFMTIPGLVNAASTTPVDQKDLSVKVHYTSPELVEPAEVGKFDIFEMTFEHPADYGEQNNFFDIDITVEFVSPSGKIREIHGFYYDTIAVDNSLWKVRFAPEESGIWTYSYSFTYIPTGSQTTGNGTFNVIEGSNPGFLRQNPVNPFRFQFENREPFVPIGFNTCISTNNIQQMDGGDRSGVFGGKISTDIFLQSYNQAGFNIFRFSQSNCSPDLVDESLSIYYKDNAMYFDLLMKQLRTNDYRIFFGLFGYLLPNNSDVPPQSELFCFIDYVINRWGAYIDIWELQNERSAYADWIKTVAGYLREWDPYNHLITTSFPQPELNEIEINTPHWYLHENVLDSDKVTSQQAKLWKLQNKPVIVGEHGNSSAESEPGNWMTDSALGMRIRSWTAFFNEISLIFWNNSGSTNANSGLAANIYLGPIERQYVHILQWYSNMVIQNDLRMSEVELFDDELMRAYGLTSEEKVGMYFHHYDNHKNILSEKIATYNFPFSGKGYWISPATGMKLGEVVFASGINSLTIPDFVVDIAFLGVADSLLDTFNTDPIAIAWILNLQADGDLDNDGIRDYGPTYLPFGISPLFLIYFTGISTDLDGGSLEYLWDFGDGSRNATRKITAHRYSTGNYFTNLTVTDNESRKASFSFIVRVSDSSDAEGDGTLTLSGLQDITVREGELVLISPHTNELEDDEETGNMNNSITYTATGIPEGASFGERGETWGSRKNFWWVPSFSQSGSYTVVFTVDDGNGISESKKVEITVLDAIPLN
ncbi:hypothetical protein SCALIN_C11_0042 [Candidatus Scalindua japonica]|uniref:PKD domain-containing protein n=1 Tax=Candidatus Scalindua japonica TaxID=1284222 RepID=A0A286TX72_9BACT|nr:PKD domain-containing protein [Candidatus Scalindua japonica]GAX60431.1 hypothetical protein SCALIN_C11_0042 [Candidatus Scalindua japonica]